MTKGTKIALIVAISAIVLGLVFMSVTYAFASKGFLKKMISAETAVYERREFSAALADVSLIDAEDENNAVRIVAGDAEQVLVSYSVSEFDTYQVSLSDGGTLSVRYASLARWIDRFGFHFRFDREPLVITVPATSEIALRLSTSNSSISASSVSVGALTARTSNGAVEMEKLHVSGKLDIDTSNGPVRLSDVGTGEIDAATSNGRISASGLYSEKDMDLETGNAAIDADGIKTGTGDIELVSSNGSIKALVGEPSDAYTIESSTSNGRSNLPESWGSGEKELSVRTSNADIDVTFAD